MGIYRHGVCEGLLDRIGAQRRKTASGSPKGEQSESINKINKMQLSLSAQGKEEFRPDQMLSHLFLKFGSLIRYAHPSGCQQQSFSAALRFCPNLSSVFSDSLVPTRLTLRANLRLLYLKGPAFSIVVNSAGFPPLWPVRRRF